MNRILVLNTESSTPSNLVVTVTRTGMLEPAGLSEDFVAQLLEKQLFAGTRGLADAVRAQLTLLDVPLALVDLAEQTLAAGLPARSALAIFSAPFRPTTVGAGAIVELWVGETAFTSSCPTAFSQTSGSRF